MSVDFLFQEAVLLLVLTPISIWPGEAQGSSQCRGETHCWGESFCRRSSGIVPFQAVLEGKCPSSPLQPWHNPLAPDSVPDSVNYGTEKVSPLLSSVLWHW